MKLILQNSYGALYIYSKKDLLDQQVMTVTDPGLKRHYREIDREKRGNTVKENGAKYSKFTNIPPSSSTLVFIQDLYNFICSKTQDIGLNL